MMGAPIYSMRAEGSAKCARIECQKEAYIRGHCKDHDPRKAHGFTNGDAIPMPGDILGSGLPGGYDLDMTTPL